MIKEKSMKKTILILTTIILILILATVGLTVKQVNDEEKRLTVDLQYRTSLLAENLKEKTEPYELEEPGEPLQEMINATTSKMRVEWTVVYNSKESILAQSQGFPKNNSKIKEISASAMDSDKITSDFANIDGKRIYLLSVPLRKDRRVAGALTIGQNANYIDLQIKEIWRSNLIRLGLYGILTIIAGFIIFELIIYIPVMDLVEQIKLTRIGKIKPFETKFSGNFVLKPLINEISYISKSLFEARMTASEEARLRLEKLDSPWTAERLRQYVKELLKGKTIFVISNREPYIHTNTNGKIGYYVPASGMVTAIEPILKACGGTWIAHGNGPADREVVDKNDRVQVPPYEPKYTLKRIWLTKEDEDKYYFGFSNEGIWPLCHSVHTRPVFRKDDWIQYKKVNGKFARAILKEIRNVTKPLIFIQDFHFTLLPRMIKNSRPDAQIAVFWHVPWPNSESFGICPFRLEILDGLLGADLIGFHTQLHCNNFIDTVGRELESLTDLEQFAIRRQGHTTYVKPFPISIDFAHDYSDKDDGRKIIKDLGIEAPYIGIGVDRLDYTKGIIERLKAVEYLLETKPEYQSKFTFIQIAPASRDKIEEYRMFGESVEKEVERINSKFRKNGWKPIVYLKKHHTHEEIYMLFRQADVCLVTSLHDGMNLVAKEYIAARNDEKGVLILSKFTGASRELKDALIVNPYDIEQVAESINQALQMPLSEQKTRMKRMREIIENNNVYRWSAEILKTMINLN
jgi:trehalose 6-phosphate synthase